MSLPPNASALVSAGGQNAVGPSFQQQSSVDWVALGQQQFSMSIAILGRLSSAGVEPLTVTVGQAICSRIPLGTHGEKMLSEAMAGLKACSSFGDVVWFGVGVRHILRVLVQTSQGASLVALCAALSEGHNIPTSALVLHEMAKRFGSPSELTPSYLQWQALVKVCASAFCHTTLGIKIDQILRLVGEDKNLLVQCREGTVGHPEDLAHIISLIGDVASDRLLNVSIIGGPACSWVAVFAESVLGLRVMIKNSDEHVLSANFDSALAEEQVAIKFNSKIPQGSITCVGRMYVLHPGDDFIRVFFRGFDVKDSPSPALNPFLGGRVDKDTMLKDIFGDALRGILPKGFPKAASKVTDLRPLLVNFFVAGATFYVYCTAECARYANLYEFIHAALVHIPELNQLKELLLKAADSIRITSIDRDIICRRFWLAREELALRCPCQIHPRVPGTYSESGDLYCSGAIAETILILIYLLSRLRMDVPIQLRRISILKFHEGLEGAWRRSIDKGLQPQELLEAVNRCLMRQEITGRIADLLSFYMSLFSEAMARFPQEFNAVSAISDGRLFCFVDTVREFSDRYDRASVVYIGPGFVQAGSRVHQKMYDGSEGWATKFPTTRIGPLVTDVQALLQQDTTSPELKVVALVEDNIRLLFWYRLLSMRGTILISPASFTDNYRTVLWTTKSA